MTDLVRRTAPMSALALATALTLTACSTDSDYHYGKLQLELGNYQKAYGYLKESSDPRAEELLASLVYVPLTWSSFPRAYCSPRRALPLWIYPMDFVLTCAKTEMVMPFPSLLADTSGHTMLPFLMEHLFIRKNMTA